MRSARSTSRLAAGWPLYVVLLMGWIPSGVCAQDAALPSNQGFATVRKIMAQHCSACHGWADSYEGITDPSRVTPYQPQASALYLYVESDEMPPSGPGLTGEQKLLLKTWIEAGATADEAPLTAAGAAEAQRRAAPQAAAGAALPPVKPRNVLATVRYHEIAGFTSAGLLLAAGVVGTVKWVDFMRDGHAYRDSLGVEEPGAQCADYLHGLWSGSSQQALRWTHVGLIVSGSALYLGNAITGLSFPPDSREGLTPRRLHRYAFYTHAALMAANIAMGFATTWVLQHGTHEQMLAAGITHTAIGLAVPLVMIGSGVAIGLMK